MTPVRLRLAFPRLALCALPLALLACSPGQDGAAGGSVSAPALNIPYRSEATLAVGEQVVIHGARSACGQPAPEWSEIELPTLAHGVFVEGLEGVRTSRSCGGPTPARGVVYQAVSPGTDSFTLFGDPIVITVE